MSVSGNRLGNRSRRRADGEKPSRDFLPAADLRKRAVSAGVQIDRQRLLPHRGPVDDP